jgi:acetyl-CoA carboxylase carboxyltransferase component
MKRVTARELDIHPTGGKLADLRKRAKETVHPVGEAAVEKVHAKGKLTACARIYTLARRALDSFRQRFASPSERPDLLRRRQ